MNIMRLRRFGLFLFVLCAAAAAQTPASLGADDRSAIQALVTSYAQALGACRAEEFADLFVPGTGYFASGFRGHIVGRDKLIELVESERHCLAPAGSAQAARPGAGAGPTVEIEIDGDAVRGVADLGTAQYQDEYTKTPAGWRFASRTVIVAAEEAAGLDAAGLLRIQQLAGPELGDYYEPDDNGVARLLTSGVRVTVADGEVTGRSFLRAGGYREQVYQRLESGDWRIRSSRYVPAVAFAPASNED
jgi:SnoaL-like domain